MLTQRRREILEKAWKSPNIGKHGKRKKTIAKEQRRKIFDEIISQEFEEDIKKARPEYKLDQFIGKAPDQIDLRVRVKKPFMTLAQYYEELRDNHGKPENSKADKKD